MRGKVACAFQLLDDLRITPAHAGKSGFDARSLYDCSDHPRPCGEKSGSASRSAKGAGSPPPMRGKAVRAFAAIRRDRITPAHAGKRLGAQALRRPCQDHPRPCGEKCRAPLRVPCLPGSPPPMRGKVNHKVHEQIEHRITPAHAGKSHLITMKRCHQQDHPRPCGEKYPPAPRL